MTRPRPRRTTTFAILLATLAGSGLAACSPAGSGGSVSVIAPWLGAEESGFRQVLDAFTDKTGIQVNYQGTRAYREVLLSSVRGGTPPDIAVLPSPGEMANYARDETLYPLDSVIDARDREGYSEQWLLPLQVDDATHIYAVPLKANLKSLIWFNPAHPPQPQPPRTWDQLMAYSEDIATAGGVPWCMGMGDGPASGWPGSDMIGSILLHRSGPDAYRRWTAGQLPWTSPEIRTAWQTWGEIATRPESTRGGATAALLTDFGHAASPMFTDPPGCYLEHQASFIMGFYREHEKADGSSPQPGVDFDFFGFPTFAADGGDLAPLPYAVSADLAGMFNDTPEARRLMGYLASEQAQQIWPSIEGSSAFTVNQQVPASVYPDEVSRRIAGILTTDALCLDAAELMPANLRNAYYRTVLEYLNDPEDLDPLLARLDQVREAVEPEQWLDRPCPIA